MEVDRVWCSTTSSCCTVSCSVVVAVTLQRVDESLRIGTGRRKHGTTSTGRQTCAQGRLVRSGEAGAKVGVAKVVASSGTGEHCWA